MQGILGLRFREFLGSSSLSVSNDKSVQPTWTVGKMIAHNAYKLPKRLLLYILLGFSNQRAQHPVRASH